MMTADRPDQVADPCQCGDNGIGNAPGHKKVEGADAIGEGRKEKAKETVGEAEHRSRQQTRQKQASRMAQKPENRYQGQDHQQASAGHVPLQGEPLQERNTVGQE